MTVTTLTNCLFVVRTFLPCNRCLEAPIKVVAFGNINLKKPFALVPAQFSSKVYSWLSDT